MDVCRLCHCQCLGDVLRLCCLRSLAVVTSVTPEAMSEFMSGSRVPIQPMAVLMSAARVTTKVHVDANGQDYGLKPS